MQSHVSECFDRIYTNSKFGVHLVVNAQKGEQIMDQVVWAAVFQKKRVNQNLHTSAGTGSCFCKVIKMSTLNTNLNMWLYWEGPRVVSVMEDQDLLFLQCTEFIFFKYVHVYNKYTHTQKKTPTAFVTVQLNFNSGSQYLKRGISLRHTRYNLKIQLLTTW